MFDRLFTSPRGLARHRDGPLAEERCRYLAHCAALRMTPGALRVIAAYTLSIAKTLRLADRPGELVTRAEIEAGADRYVRLSSRRHPRRPKKRKGGFLWRSFKSYAVRWLTFLGRLQRQVVEQPYGDRVAQFADHLRQERGLAPLTIAYSKRTLSQFLGRMGAAQLRFKTLTVAQVNQLLAEQVRDGGYARRTVSRWASVLRGFFAYAERQGWCRPGLAAAIRAPRVYRFAGLPTGPSWDDVQRLLAAADGDRPTDIRDRALLLLLAVYGLRAGEVRALRLEDFDWKQELLHVPHGKRQKPRTYPLSHSVGDAVLRYLREVRPRTDHREVFLLLRAPFQPIGRGCLAHVVRDRLRALGLTLPHYGPHALRHACATHLLSQGLSLKEIGDHLGHRSPESTRVYAKVDLAALRSVGDLGLEGLL
jgi:site-specific recombinase XerD